MGKGQRAELEAALSARIEVIFDRSPGLCGFSIDERLVSGSAKEGPREWELYVSAVETLPELGDGAKRFIGEISGALGLYLAKRIVTAHGGKVEARSSKETGTMLEAMLPLA